MTPFSSARWIASPDVGDQTAGVPAPHLRKPFVITRPILRAELCITALGLYTCEINGQTVGDFVLAPGWTDYDKRIHFQTFEVARFLNVGANAIGATLGDGWYCGSVGLKPRQIYGDRPALLVQLTIFYKDGSLGEITSDSTWRTASSPIVQNDLLAGEEYDARLEKPGWSSPGFDDSGWQSVSMPSLGNRQFAPSPAPPIRRAAQLNPVSAIDLNPQTKVVDFGQNFSGRIRITVDGEAGQRLQFRFSEMLNPDRTLYLENLRGAKATDLYICKGTVGETWEPSFTFHGFRYLEIHGLKPGQNFQVAGVVLHSDTRSTGSFSCSEPLLNQLQSNIVWGQKSNFLDVPTDCPQRDERLGWTGDAQVFIRTACFNMDVRGFFHKWMQDLRDAQRENGALPPVAPDKNFVDGVEDGGPAWSDAVIICPWTIYQCYGDLQILADNYEAMQRYMRFLSSNRCKGYVRSHPEMDSWGGFGDWLALDGSGRLDGGTPRDLIGTAFYAYGAEIMSKIATLVGREEDAQIYHTLHQEIVTAFRQRFISADGSVSSGTQTAYALALKFGLVPAEKCAAAVAKLVDHITQRQFHLATGFVGTPYLLDVLTDHGHLDIAYKLLQQETFPSWLFPVKNGATTIWERWDGWTAETGFQDKAMNSFNHYAYGAVGDWMYRKVAGLDLDPADPGYRHIQFTPRPGGTITWAEGKLLTSFGPASIRWELNPSKFICIVTVPEGTRATFYSPFSAGDVRSLGPGTHHLSLPKPV